jgi:hypothetical protein
LQPARNAFSVLVRAPISQKDATGFSFCWRRRCRGFPVARSGRRIRRHLEASRRNCCSSRVGRRASDTSGPDAFFCCARLRCALDGLLASSVGFGSSFASLCCSAFGSWGVRGDRAGKVKARESCPYRTVKQKLVPAPAAERRASSSRISFPYGAFGLRACGHFKTWLCPFHLLRGGSSSTLPSIPPACPQHPRPCAARTQVIEPSLSVAADANRVAEFRYLRVVRGCIWASSVGLRLRT